MTVMDQKAFHVTPCYLKIKCVEDSQFTFFKHFIYVPAQVEAYLLDVRNTFTKRSLLATLK